jgi:hypothetical protein
MLVDEPLFDVLADVFLGRVVSEFAIDVVTDLPLGNHN